MFSNIQPFICSNSHEFDDERLHLKCFTFPKIKSEFEKLNINFEPIDIKWDENSDYFKNGHLLRLLLHNIQQASPFYTCLIGQRYGPHINKKDNNNGSISLEINNKLDSYMQRNLLIASQTGYSHLVNPSTYNNSFLEFQINTALLNENCYPFYRFYYRQIEYIDDKFSQLPIEERRRTMHEFESENEYCSNKIKDLKLKVAKKGIIVKYYRTLEQLDQFIYDDYMEMLLKNLSEYLSSNKSKFELKLESLTHNNLSNYVISDSIKEMIKQLDLFCLTKNVESNKKISFDENGENSEKYENSSVLTANSNNEESQTEEYLEILKLRHINLASSVGKNLNETKSKQIFLIYGPRASGKTSFLLQMYKNINTVTSGTFSLADIPDSLKNRSIASSSTKSLNNNNKPKPFFLFYFLNPQDNLISILVDIIHKIRLKYAKLDGRLVIDSDLHDSKSIIEQFHSSLELGPSIILIDGLDGLNSKQKLSTWLPPKIEAHTKFVLTLRKSSEYYTELKANSYCESFELNVFKQEKDYHNLFGKLLDVNSNKDSNNVLFGKFLSIFNEFKMAHHASSPLYAKLIAQEIFSFDKDIFKANPVTSARYPREDSASSSSFDLYDDIKVNSSLSYSSMSSSSARTTSSVNVMQNYIEEVSTLRELIQKIIKRYIKRNNWSTNKTMPISLENNCGWVGDTLCLISLSQHGLKKTTILRILNQRGYTNDLEVTEMNWAIFRMTFGFFIQDNFNGVLSYSHEYFKETVQTLLLDGFFVTNNVMPEPNLPPCRQNISNKQKDIHSSIIFDILTNQLVKEDFDHSSQIDIKDSENSDLIENYLEKFHELIHHLYMIYDLVDLCKLLTNFKVIHIFYENRFNYLNEWFDLCNYLKLTTNLDVLRSILLSSLTIGVPQYAIEIRETSLTLKKITQHEIDININKSEYLEPSINKTPNEVDIQPSRISMLSKLSKSLLDVNEIYQPRIDSLLDLSDIIDLSKEKYGDSINLMLVHRTLILIDLVKHLDDKFFQDNYSFHLCKLVDNIIIQNYPLNGIERLKYSILLQYLAKMSIQLSDFESALKYFIKCIEILEDLYQTFHILDINKKYKSKLHFLNIVNRLSILHSNMAFLLLKMNNLNGANALLSKSNSFLSENISDIGTSLEFELAMEQHIIKYEMENKEKTDTKQLIYHQNVDALYKNKKMLLKHDFEDIGSYESLYSYFFIAGIYEVQRTNFYDAHKYFKNALNISMKWYGKLHLNTSRVYHYFGCFYSLKDMQFYNSRRSELYLRKALFIREKYKESEKDFKIKFNQIKSNTNQNNGENFQSAVSIYQTNSNLFRNSDTCEFTNEKYISNEEKNNIAEILFDLGCLLATYESKLSKREGIDCLRKSHDIKIIILGSEHPDCLSITEKINDLIRENASSKQKARKTSSNSINMRDQNINSRNSSSFLPPASSAKSSFVEMPPKTQLENSLSQIKKHLYFNYNSNHYDEFSKWVKKNSIIELIPSKLDKDLMRKNSGTSQSDLYQSEDEFVKSFAFNPVEQELSIDQETTTSSSRHQKQPQLSSKYPEKSILIKTKSTESLTAKLKMNKSKSAINVGFTDASKESIDKKTYHSKHCKCPTAVSIDVHNSKTVHGPNSSIASLLNTKNSSNLPVQHRNLKRIYYKSSWYDIPQGSISYRFKNYIKLAPNA